MPDYEKMYYQLFNEITNIINQLKNAQKTAEELFLNQENTVIYKIKSDTQKK